MKLRIAKKVLKAISGPDELWAFDRDSNLIPVKLPSKAVSRRDRRRRRNGEGYRLSTAFKALDRAGVLR